jgi:tetratricopeptide (TPR) repeat protein
MMPAFRLRISMPTSFREILAAAALVMLAPLHVEAQTYELSQVYRLPVYCKYTQLFRDRVPGGNNPAEIERWTTLMGGTFNHMHHYCWGLMDVNRAVFSSRTRQERVHELSASIGEFDYVIKQAPPGFPLMPEILTKRAESLIQLDRGVEGAVDLQRAIEIQADYAPAYAAISDFYKQTGALGKAREWLEKGLSAAPNAHALKRRLVALDAAKGKRKNNPQPPVER